MFRKEEWEQVSRSNVDLIERVVVTGGWLYRTYLWNTSADEIIAESINVTFVAGKKTKRKAIKRKKND
jgi:hypothetical protein